MSTQSIDLKNIGTIREQLEKDLFLEAKNFLLKKRFGLGCGADRKRRNHALTLNAIVNTENCELIQYIKAEIDCW